MFSHSVVSDSLRPHGLQHARFPCPSPSPRVIQTHVHWVGGAIQPSHPLSSPSPPAFNLSQHQVFFSESVLLISGQSIGVSASASVLLVNIQGWFPLGWTGLISLKSKGLSRVFSSIAVLKHQFFGSQSSLWSNSHVHKWLLEKLWLYGPLSAKWYLCFLIHSLGLSWLFFQGASIF